MEGEGLSFKLEAGDRAAAGMGGPSAPPGLRKKRNCRLFVKRLGFHAVSVSLETEGLQALGCLHSRTPALREQDTLAGQEPPGQLGQ